MTINIGLSRFTQIIKIMENSNLISQGKEIKLVYHLNECIVPYQQLKEKNNHSVILSHEDMNITINIKKEI